MRIVQRTIASFVAAVAATTAMPLTAAGADIGTGAIAGMADFGPDGIPAPLALCRPVAFALEATTLTASIGTLALVGSGSGSCESFQLGGGFFTAAVDFEAIDGTDYDCPTTGGSYLRSTYQLDLILPASCTVNGYGLARLVVTIRATLVPDTPYGWFVGSFGVVPAW